MSDAPFQAPMSGREQPSRQAVAGHERLTVLDHPLTASLMTVLRNIQTPTAQFEQAMHELSRRLIWQATRNEPVSMVEVPTFSGGTTPAWRMTRHIGALVILRAGLGMVTPLRSLIPDAPIYQVGIKRNETTLIPALYTSNLGAGLRDIEHLLLLDPMLATGGSAALALRLARSEFDGDVSFVGLIGAPLGVSRLLDVDSRVRVLLAALDEGLDERGYIIPGLGDAGDRLFGTN
jgi:uracil phosphoribosyltransferase